jgi:EPS-associated MarR family transcriptional regulator
MGIGAALISSTLTRSRCEQHPAMSKPTTTDANTAAALETLRLLGAQPELSQRQLSQALGLSLGKTHYVLRALLDKGLLKAENFKRSDNKVAYAYLLTPKGIKAKLRMTRQFLARKETEFELLQATIAQLRREVDPEGSAEHPRSKP